MSRVKILLLVIVIVVVENQMSFAQPKPSRYEIIVTGGPGKAEFYNLKSNFYVDFGEVLAGYAAGLFQYHFTDRLSLKTGLAYERNGCRVHFENYEWNSGYGDYTDCYLHSDYLSIPIILQMEVGNRFRFYINTGAYSSFLVNYSYKITTNGDERYSPDIVVSPDSHHEDMKFDLGVSGEAGFKVIILRKYSASIGFTDHYGLLNSKKLPDFVRNITGDPMTGNNESKNNAYFIVAGFSYLLK